MKKLNEILEVYEFDGKWFIMQKQITDFDTKKEAEDFIKFYDDVTWKYINAISSGIGQNYSA